LEVLDPIEDIGKQVFKNSQIGLCVWTTFNKLETNAVQEEILDRYINKYTSVYGEKIREICKAAEIRQNITDQLVIASPQEKV
jgi:4-hydroxy-3-methylbut-2-enyl diphosphate reductase IspH